MTRVIDEEFNPTPEQQEYLSNRSSSAEAAEERLRAADASDALGEYVCRMPGRADVFVVLDGLVRLRARVAELEAKVAAPPWETLNVLDGEIDRLQAEVDRCHALYPSLQNK